ncbi:uncharacterized protein VTP21DRAFT_3654 [Calcarisporiella thermophila]|uniref:uncharacterized protein n=1 Tax=Calcarisporiella thermophila TaxID=911321 RepID=UPI0037421D97
MADLPTFSKLNIASNEFGWGPSSEALPPHLTDIPYAPFSKGDKLGRIADWSAPEGRDTRETTGRRQGHRQRDNYQTYGAGVLSAFTYQHAEDEASFSVVDRTATQKKTTLKTTGGFRGGRTGFATRGGRGRGTFQKGAAPPARGRGRGRGRFGWRDYDKPQRMRDASVNITAEWKLIEQVEFARLGKLSFEVEEPEDIEWCGKLYYYDKAYDRVNTKSERPLLQLDRVRYNITTSEDPILQQYAKEKKATVFATDTILNFLMCATRSVYPWDMVINRVGSQVFFDKRDDGAFDYVSVNENSQDPPSETSDKDAINSRSALSLEATYINQNYGFQVVNEKKSKGFKKPNPFVSEADEQEPLASCAYRYRKFDLSSGADEELTMIVRTELDATVEVPASQPEPVYVTVHALNEFDPRAQGAGGALDWRTKLDTQRGAVVATEMKNNSFKLARWAVQSILAGADQMKLGYVSRMNPKDPSRHVILGTQTYRPRDLAAQMNFSLANGWGIVKAIVDMCLRLDEGKYVLVKDPNRPIIRLYSVPPSTFEDEEEDVSLQDDATNADEEGEEDQE